jgi:hypothetical protein
MTSGPLEMLSQKCRNTVLAGIGLRIKPVHLNLTEHSPTDLSEVPKHSPSWHWAENQTNASQSDRAE